MTDIRHGGHDTVYLTYLVPTRGLLGFRGAFLTATRERGSMVAWENDTSTAYALRNAEECGVLFIGPGVEVYEGMIVGQNARGKDMPINVAKKKHLTNMHVFTKDIVVRLTPPHVMSLDDCIEYISDDELLEVTPLNLRMRKRILNTDMRRKSAAGRDISQMVDN